MNAVDESLLHRLCQDPLGTRAALGVVKLEIFCTNEAVSLQGSMPQALTRWITGGSSLRASMVATPPNLARGFTDISHPETYMQLYLAMPS
jgi:hypothetical protein